MRSLFVIKIKDSSIINDIYTARELRRDSIAADCLAGALSTEDYREYVPDDRLNSVARALGESAACHMEDEAVRIFNEQPAVVERHSGCVEDGYVSDRQRLSGLPFLKMRPSDCCGMCGCKKSLGSDCLCARCRDIEKLMGECFGSTMNR